MYIYLDFTCIGNAGYVDFMWIFGLVIWIEFGAAI